MPKAKGSKTSRSKGRASKGKKKLSDGALKDLEVMDERTRAVKGGALRKRMARHDFRKRERW